MKLKELNIIGLSFSQSQAGSYVLVLSERKSGKKLPIIINPDTAQYIALKMEDVKVKRPLTIDLIKDITDKLGADLFSIEITNILEGIFYVNLNFHNMVEEFKFDASISDALCLAIAYKCPIFCSKQVLDVAGIEMDDDGTMTEEQYKENHKGRDFSRVVTVESLEKMLNKAIENEEYEIASQLRDRIKDLKEKTENNKQ